MTIVIVRFLIRGRLEHEGKDKTADNQAESTQEIEKDHKGNRDQADKKAEGSGTESGLAEHERLEPKNRKNGNGLHMDTDVAEGANKPEGRSNEDMQITQ